MCIPSLASSQINPQSRHLLLHGYWHRNTTALQYNSFSPLPKSTPHTSPSVQFSHSVVSASLRPHGLQHARPPCPSPTPGVYLNSCPLSWWCHPTIASSVVPFSSCLQSFPASGFFQMSQLFTSDGVSVSTSVLPMNTSILTAQWCIYSGQNLTHNTWCLLLLFVPYTLYHGLTATPSANPITFIFQFLSTLLPPLWSKSPCILTWTMTSAPYWSPRCSYSQWSTEH